MTAGAAGDAALWIMATSLRIGSDVACSDAPEIQVPVLEKRRNALTVGDG